MESTSVYRRVDDDMLMTIKTAKLLDGTLLETNEINQSEKKGIQLNMAEKALSSDINGFYGKPDKLKRLNEVHAQY